MGGLLSDESSDTGCMEVGDVAGGRTGVVRSSEEFVSSRVRRYLIQRPSGWLVVGAGAGAGAG